MPLSVAILVQYLLVWHQDRLGVAGGLTKTAAHDAQERLNHRHFSVFFFSKNVFRTNFDAF
jgi:isopentenyldiphosphate isomerase